MCVCSTNTFFAVGPRATLSAVGGGQRPIKLKCFSTNTFHKQRKAKTQRTTHQHDDYRQHLHALDPDLDPNDPIHTRSSRLDDRRMAPRLESQHLDSHSKLRRPMGASQDIRTARKFTGTLLPNSITNSHTSPAKHSHERQSSGDKE